MTCQASFKGSAVRSPTLIPFSSALDQSHLSIILNKAFSPTCTTIGASLQVVEVQTLYKKMPQTRGQSKQDDAELPRHVKDESPSVSSEEGQMAQPVLLETRINPLNLDNIPVPTFTAEMYQDQGLEVWLGIIDSVRVTYKLNDLESKLLASRRIADEEVRQQLTRFPLEYKWGDFCDGLKSICGRRQGPAKAWYRFRDGSS